MLQWAGQAVFTLVFLITVVTGTAVASVNLTNIGTADYQGNSYNLIA